MTKDVFIGKYQDELLGLLLAAFTMEENTRGLGDINHKHRGLLMRETVHRSKSFLDRVYAELVSRAESP